MKTTELLSCSSPIVKKIRISTAIDIRTEVARLVATSLASVFQIETHRFPLVMVEIQKMCCAALDGKEKNTLQFSVKNGKRIVDSKSAGVTNLFVLENIDEVYDIVCVFIEMFRQKYNVSAVYEDDFVINIIVRIQNKITSIEQMCTMSLNDVLSYEDFTKSRSLLKG
jgi:hypothetical protein